MALSSGGRWAHVAAVLTAAVSLAAGALLAVAAAPPSTRGSESAAAALSRGRALYAQGQYAQAAAAADRALAIDPKNDDARLLKQAIAQHLAAASAPAAASNPAGITLLTPAQVSAIRLAELHDDDTHLLAKIDHNVLVQFWNEVVKAEPGVDTSRQA